MLEIRLLKYKFTRPETAPYNLPMFGRSFHYLQVFPLIILLYAGIRHENSLLVNTQAWDAYFLGGLAAIGLLCLSFPPRAYLRNIVVTCTFLSLCISMNHLFFKPSTAVISILFVSFASIRLLGAKHLEVMNLVIRKHHLILSYMFLLIAYLVVEPNNSSDTLSCYLAFCFGGTSCLFLALRHIGKKTGRYLQVIAVLSISSLYFLKFNLSLQYLSFFLFLSSGTLISYVLVTKKNLALLEKKYTKLFSKPEIITVGYFLFFAFLGSLLLQSSISQANPYDDPYNFIDSFFTAMSAICVTGLSIFDPATDLSSFGQLILLCLIQLGGLGITSLSAWVLMILSSKRLNVGHEDAIHKITGSQQKIDIRSLVKRIFYYFIVFESLGTSLLSVLFYLQGDPIGKALWRALFTSISAFCNAGFALQSNSLIPYQESNLTLFVVSLLIIAGGFAPLLVINIPKKWRKNKFSLQDKLVFTSTLSLLMTGFFFILVVEWNHSMVELSYWNKFGNAWFQSVTARTAGFSSVDFSSMREISQYFYLLLMFIGGNPGSTAGGVKTITVAILIVSAINAIRENPEARIFDKQIPIQTIFKAILILFLGLAVHFVFFFALSVTQDIDSLSLLFETFSALGTVGLSIGATSELNAIGKVLIILCMLAGRVGPLTFILLMLRKAKPNAWKVPKEDVSIT